MCRNIRKSKIRFLPAILAALLLLSGCGVTKVKASYVTSGRVETKGGYTVRFTPAESRAMSNMMIGNRFAHTGKTLYGSRHDELGLPYLCRMKYTAGQNGMYVRETEAIETRVDAQYLTISDSFLYYLREEMDGKTSLARLSVASGAALKPETLYDAPCDFLSIRDGRLYFTDEVHHLCSLAPDGTDKKVLLADKEIYYPYLLTADLLLYQDDADGESLHLRYLPTGFDLRIAPGRVFGFVLQGSELYFLRCEEREGEKCRLCRTDLNDFLSQFDPLAAPNAAFAFEVETSPEVMGPRFCLNGEHINASNYKSAALSQWQSLSDDAWEVGYTAACQYVAEEFEIFYDYDKEGRIEKMLFYEPALKRPGYIELYRYS